MLWTSFDYTPIARCPLCPQGKFTEAEPLFERSQTIYEKALGCDHPQVAIVLNNRAGLFEKQVRAGRSCYLKCCGVLWTAFGTQRTVPLWKQRRTTSHVQGDLLRCYACAFYISNRLCRRARQRSPQVSTGAFASPAFVARVFQVVTDLWVPTHSFLRSPCMKKSSHCI